MTFMNSFNFEVVLLLNFIDYLIILMTLTQFDGNDFILCVCVDNMVLYFLF